MNRGCGRNARAKRSKYVAAWWGSPTRNGRSRSHLPDGQQRDGRLQRSEVVIPQPGGVALRMELPDHEASATTRPSVGSAACEASAEIRSIRGRMMRIDTRCALWRPAWFCSSANRRHLPHGGPELVAVTVLVLPQTTWSNRSSRECRMYGHTGPLRPRSDSARPGIPATTLRS